MAIDLEPGLATVGNARLVRTIIEEMAGGVMPFERFMELALYHPEHGYYRKPGRIGPQGDFLTSPSIHPLFGWAVAGWCHQVWRDLEAPGEFTIFEPGAGNGQLAGAILDWAEGRDDGFREALRYVAFEPHNPGSDPRVTWAETRAEPVEFGAVVSNEFFDALPVRVFEGSARGPVEIGARWDGEGFVEARLGVCDIEGAPAEGRFEVNPRAFPAMRGLCQLIRRGAVLTIDYGYPREQLWAPWRTQGTLLCFYRHTAHENPYVHVGEQDMTSHVDLDDLEAAMAAEGMETFGPVSQADFLTSLGVHALIDRARNDLPEYFARRRAVEQLTDAAGLGRIRVLAGTRGYDARPPGFEVAP